MSEKRAEWRRRWRKRFESSSTYHKKHRERAKKYYEERTVIVLKAKDKPCMDCGQVFHHCAMDFDHRSNEIKLFAIAQGKHHSEEKLRAEIAKCDVVCANCHRVRTWKKGHQ